MSFALGILLFGVVYFRPCLKSQDPECRLAVLEAPNSKSYLAQHLFPEVPLS